MKKLISAIAIILLAIVILSLNSDRSGQNAAPIKVVAFLSMTGDAAAWGENAQRAIALATRERNEAGGVNGRKIDMIYEDTAGDSKKAVSAFQRAVSVQKADAVIGPLSQSEDAAVVPLIDSTGMPTVIPGYLPLQNRKNLHNPLLIWMDAEREAASIADYVFSEGVRKIAVVGSLDAWESTVSNAFVERFMKLGGDIVAKEIVQPDASDMKLSAAKISAAKPDAVFLGTYYQFVNSTKALNDIGFKGKLYSIEVDDYLAGETGAWTNGLQFISPDYYSQDFIDKFQKEYDTAPGLPAGQAYDATNILFSLLEKGTDREVMSSSMMNFKGYDGVSGRLTIDENGRTSLPAALFEIRAGKITKLREL